MCWCFNSHLNVWYKREKVKQTSKKIHGACLTTAISSSGEAKYKLSSKLGNTVPCNFLNNIWTAFVVPWNSMKVKQHKLKFHGIPWNCVQIHKFVEIHGTFSILPSSMEPPPPPPPSKKSSKEFHGIPLNCSAVPCNSIEFNEFDIETIHFPTYLFGFWWMIMYYLAEYPRNVTYSIDFNIITRILNTPVSAKWPKANENGQLFFLNSVPFMKRAILWRSVLFLHNSSMRHKAFVGHQIAMSFTYCHCLHISLCEVYIAQSGKLILAGEIYGEKFDAVQRRQIIPFLLTLARCFTVMLWVCIPNLKGKSK